MRIKTINLSWFRGAAESASLEPNGKSMVVYGSNGSGKSSFVDAIEYVLEGGRINHLAHEYSGNRQEKGILNTCRPADQPARINIKFQDGSELKCKIYGDGSCQMSGETAVASWVYRQTVLRQDEVAEFIRSRKGQKYSALVPLLGLEPLELAAENMHKLAKSVKEQSKLEQKKDSLERIQAKRTAMFGSDSDEQIQSALMQLHVKYCAEAHPSEDMAANCEDLRAAIEERIQKSNTETREFIALQEAARTDLGEKIRCVRASALKTASGTDPLIKEKLRVLGAATEYAAGLSDLGTISCPACGTELTVDEFKTHIQSERERLEILRTAFDGYKRALGSLCDLLNTLRVTFAKEDLKMWRDGMANGALSSNLACLESTDIAKLRDDCGEDELRLLETRLEPLILEARNASQSVPPDAQKLSTDKQQAEIWQEILEANKLSVSVAKLEELLDLLDSVEEGIRKELHSRVVATIREISEDIRTMWAILHPGEEITDIELYLPKEDKAIDIKLSFYGKDQDSPRLTLSEGHRNSLGLCIFLSMAKRNPDADNPVFLDDVVVSLDRNHRGMIAELLKEHFGGRQVILLTHDREWYTELRAQLDSAKWMQRTLIPWESPEIGIRWSDRKSALRDAKALLDSHPDAAANEARKAMDVELPIIAEKVQMRCVYLRGEKNDRRTAHEFLDRLISQSGKCFEKRVGQCFEINTAAITDLERADSLLTTWGNRGSHGYDVTRSEAKTLITACQGALDVFKCSVCQKPVWYTEASNQELVQCQCGEIRWRYGKASK